MYCLDDERHRGRRSGKNTENVKMYNNSANVYVLREVSGGGNVGVGGGKGDEEECFMLLLLAVVVIVLVLQWTRNG